MHILGYGEAGTEGGKWQSTGSAVSSPALCSTAISAALTSHLKIPLMILRFPLKLLPQMLFEILLSCFIDVIKIQTLPTRPWSPCWICFMVLLWFFLFGKWCRELHFLGFLFHGSAENELGLTGFFSSHHWIIPALDTGSGLPLCSLIHPPQSSVLAGLIMKRGPLITLGKGFAADKGKINPPGTSPGLDFHI